jgi:hypothetical protein
MGSRAGPGDRGGPLLQRNELWYLGVFAPVTVIPVTVILAVINLVSGDMTGWVRIEGVVRELYDVAALPGTRCPSAIGFKTNEVKHVIAIDQDTDAAVAP